MAERCIFQQLLLSRDAEGVTWWRIYEATIKAPRTVPASSSRSSLSWFLSLFPRVCCYCRYSPYPFSPHFLPFLWLIHHPVISYFLSLSLNPIVHASPYGRHLLLSETWKLVVRRGRMTPISDYALTDC